MYERLRSEITLTVKINDEVYTASTTIFAPADLEAALELLTTEISVQMEDADTSAEKEGAE